MSNSRTLRIIVLVIGIAAAGMIVFFASRGAMSSHDEHVAAEEDAYSEEQADARLATLEAALNEKAAEVVPMQFFEDGAVTNEGEFSLTAVTTMPEDSIDEVSFLITPQRIPSKKKWFDGKNDGGGYYRIESSASELGNVEGTYLIEAFITPRGGEQTEAGSHEIDVRLKDYFYSEALGEGRQSLVMMHPTVERPEGDESGEATEIKKVLFKVWPEKSGQEDMTVYTAEETDNNVWSAEIDLDEFGAKGNFVANAYAVIKNTETGIASAEFELLPDPVEVPEGDGDVIREGKRVHVEVPDILQNPELPTGCESVALTIVLDSLGYELQKTDIAKNYLPRGDNFATSYVGDPFSPNGAGCFPPAIVTAANKYLSERGDTRRGHNVTGLSMEELCEYIDNGIPVMVWTSMDMREPQFTGRKVTYRDQEYEWYRSEHCVVFYGYDDEKNVYLISDPLAGYVERNKADFEKLFDRIGRYSAVIY